MNYFHSGVQMRVTDSFLETDDGIFLENRVGDTGTKTAVAMKSLVLEYNRVPKYFLNYNRLD